MKIWIVVEIDHYGDGGHSGYHARDYESLEVFTDEEKAKEYAQTVNERFACTAQIEEREINV